MLDFFITYDTELWCKSKHPSASEFSDAFDKYILGRGRSGDWGTLYQAELMHRYGVRGSFFLEALITPVACEAQTRELVARLQELGHDVQLHIHPEWLPFLDDAELPESKGPNLHMYTQSEQSTILARGLKNLEAVGARRPNAFRAGNFGASWETLHALAENGLTIDSTYNRCYLDGACAMPNDADLLQPISRNGVVEFPVAFFADAPGHLRPLHLQACSFSETRFVLDSYHASGWRSCVLLSHSFETLNAKMTGKDAIVCRRLEQLCRYLAENDDRFRSLRFGELQNPDEYLESGNLSAPVSSLGRTAGRHVEQLVRRVLY